MSKENKNGAEREKFRIEIEEHATLPAIAKTAYISSNDFCKLVSDLFKGVFADFEGSIFEAGNGGEPTVSLLFNHGQYSDDAICGCERAGGKVSGSSIIDRSRNRDRAMIEGDRYLLTEDGKDVVSELLTARNFNNGNPNWKFLVSEWQDRSVNSLYSYNQTPQYTKVSNISLQRLCNLLFGKKDPDTNEAVEYDVRIATPLTPVTGYGQVAGMPLNVNYMLTITVVSSAEVAKIYEKLGYGSVSGAKIIR